MSQTIRCPCGVQLRIGQHVAGSMVRCPKCRRQLRLSDSVSRISSSSSPQVAQPVSMAPAAGEAKIELRCGCGTRMRVRASATGKTVRCPKCQQAVMVPSGSPVMAVPLARPVRAVPPPEADDGFDFDSLDAVPVAPPAGSQRSVESDDVRQGLQRPAARQDFQRPAARQDFQRPRARQAELRPGSLPTQVVRGGAITLLAIVSLLVICQIGIGVTGAMAKRHARSRRDQRPTSFAERSQMIKQARTLGERYSNVLKVFSYGYRYLRLPAVLAVLACGVGLVMCILQVRGVLLAAVLVTLAIALVLIALDPLKRSLPLMTAEPLGQDWLSIPADMLFATTAGFQEMRGSIWTAGTIEALWGGFLGCLGVCSVLWRRQQRRGNLALPIVMSIGGFLYGLGMLALASSLATLEFIDGRGLQVIAYLLLTALLWTVLLLAVLVTHGDATAQ